MAFWLRESDCEGKHVNYICPNCGFDDGWHEYKFCPMCAEPLNDPTVQTESLISKYQHNFVSSPIETIKVGEPLSNSDEITKVIERRHGNG